jgi:hypothetical protein
MRAKKGELGLKDEDMDGMAANLSLVVAPTTLLLSKLGEIANKEDSEEIIQAVAQIFSDNVCALPFLFSSLLY